VAESVLAEAEGAKNDGQLVKAAGLYHQAERLRPRDFEVHYQLALVSLQLQDLNDAEGHLRKAISLRPDFSQAHLNL
jgi:Flp pilus assembly protein TadD